MSSMHEIETDGKYEVILNAETALVSVILRHVASFAQSFAASRIDELLIVIRELLTNAIVHGSKSDGTKMVRLVVSFSDNRFKIEVDDEGEGFEHEALDLRLPDYPFSLSRRGLIIVHELTEELVFLGRGNRARAVVHAHEAPDRGEADYPIVVAAGDQNHREEQCTNQMARN
jgi:serine/threonine-protein kinase RsbW